MRIKIYYILFFCLILKFNNFYGQELSNNEKKKVKNFKELIKGYKNDGDYNQAAHFSNQIAFIYWENNLDENAIYYFLNSINFNKETGNTNAIKSIYRNIGLIYSDKNQYSMALDYFQKSLKYAKDMRKKTSLMIAYIDVATMFQYLNKPEKSIKNMLLALEIARGLNDTKFLAICFRNLADDSKKIGNNENYEKYFDNYSNYSAIVQKEKLEKQKKKNKKEISRIKDLTKKAKEKNKELEEKSLKKEKELRKKNNELKKAKIYLYDIQRESEAKEEQIEDLNRKSNLQLELIKQKEKQLQTDRLVKTLLMLGISMVIIIVIILYRNYKQREKINSELNLKNREIQKRSREIKQQNEAIKISRNHLRAKTQEVEEALEKIKIQNKNTEDNLDYAKDIQKAIFPPQKKLNNFFTESFILLKPKDIVSGDFFYFKNLKNDIFLIAAIDCTGEGVSASLISVVGYNLLDKIVSKENFKNANEILEKLDKNFSETLKQEQNKNDDSMKISLCLVDKKNKKISFAGANQDLLLIQNNEINVLEGEKINIGGNKKFHKFVNKFADLNENITTCYLFSDGYSKQIGRTYKVFNKTNFHKLLRRIHDKKMIEQRELLDKNFDTWKGKNQKQLDDVLVIGFNI